jgi:peptide/nickel transport system ATP-binding protein
VENNILDIKDLYVIYDTDDAVVYAINGVDLTLKSGETLGLVGETGAGKTTLALSILKVLPPKIGNIERGSIIFNGIDIFSAPEKEMRKIRGEQISMIFQDPMTSLNPVLTIGDQIAESFKLHIKGISREEIDNKVDELLKLVGIQPERKKDYPHQFSGGMKQRVVIALALALEPKLLLADEPTTALDVTIQAQVLELMKNLKEKLNTAMIMITHDLGIVAMICDRVAIMYAGEIVEIGTVEDIFEGKNHHPYTIGLFNSIPDITDDVDRLEQIEGLMPDPTDLPRGCKFHPRCPQCMDICRSQLPKAFVKESQTIRCHLYEAEQ